MISEQSSAAYRDQSQNPLTAGVPSRSCGLPQTGRHNSVRARAYLTHAQTEKGEEPDPKKALQAAKDAVAAEVKKAG